MNLALKIMQRSKSNLTRPSGVPYIKQVFNTNPNVPRNIFESTSFVWPSHRNRNCSYRSNSESLRNSSTQTSKTVIALPVSDSPRMSPDSLSPKTEYNPDILCHQPVCASKSTFIEGGDVSFSRKNCVLRYLHNRDDESKEPDSTIELAGDSLTKVYLEKNRLKQFDSGANRLNSTRSRFLQQTSPLRNLTSKFPLELKNQSTSLENTKAIIPILPSMTRFKVKNVKEKPIVPNPVKPVKYFCEKDFSLNLNSNKITPRNKPCSFMSPTFSSEQKNKMRDIKTVTKLISPTRRGRSASPKANLQRAPSVIKKVPYIDKSSSSIFQCARDEPVFTLDLNNLKTARTAISSETILENCSNSDAERDLVQAILKLKDSDWNVALRGLAEIVEISRTRETQFVYPHMTIINQRIIELLKSSRSHVCRTTCQAVGHLFEYVKDTRRPEFDEIVDSLLCRTADSNKFIRHDANLALDCMVTHIPALHAVRAICTKGPDHKNALVRSASARLVVCAVVIAGSTNVLNPNSNDYTRRRVILNMVRFLNDKTMETRKYGERLYKLLATDKMFDLYIRRYLEKDTVQKLKIAFKKYHGKNLTVP
ncbi:uncharacterized protein LOC115891312 [Sitophilus oryzae]|uniref:Uncharacterized protein LOC115891312 n=1 Tax=Sitophilus oryzae TaxID=7048 RepID=A0A6J2YU33_SITOR|nr:uncharacterized protein LOC115891312 [Sitophilus oryzae]